MRNPRACRAFTLIELLVVIAILALLIATLIPTLSSARDLVRFTVCKANTKSAATGWFGFAATHGDRFPAGAKSVVENWDPMWAQILNREFYRGNDPKYYPPNFRQPGASAAYGDEPTCGPLLRFWTFWSPDVYKTSSLKDNYICCPNYRAWGNPNTGASNIWSRPWIANNHACGGHYITQSKEAIGDAGWFSLTDPASAFYQDGVITRSLMNPKGPSPSEFYTIYGLGRKIDTWVNPSAKFLMWEAEAGNDWDRYQGGGGPNSTMLLNWNNSDTSKAPWCNASGSGTSGEFAFRHLLPKDVTLYQQRARMALLYMDGHVGEWNPNDPVYRSSSFRPSE